MKAVMRAQKLSQPQVALLAKQNGYRIDQTTVGRIARAAMPATVDTLNALAAGLGFEPWQLLVDGLDPTRPPALGADLTKDELEMLENYRASGSRWKISLRYMATLRSDTEQEEVASGVNMLLAKIFGSRAVPDSRLGTAWTRPDRRQALHEPGAKYEKTKK